MLLQQNVCRGGKPTPTDEDEAWRINAFFKFEKVVSKFVKYRVSIVD